MKTAGAGRTDAGCHARGQVASLSLTTRLTAERLRPALNAHLPRDVRIVEAAEGQEAVRVAGAALVRNFTVEPN